MDENQDTHSESKQQSHAHGSPQHGAHGSKDKHSTSDSKEIVDHTEHDLILAILSYLGPLVIISYALAKDKPFVAFHIKQGLLLLAIEVASLILGSMMWTLAPLLYLINLGALIFTIIGVINVVQGKMRPLPFIGHLAHVIKF